MVQRPTFPHTVVILDKSLDLSMPPILSYRVGITLAMKSEFARTYMGTSLKTVLRRGSKHWAIEAGKLPGPGHKSPRSLSLRAMESLQCLLMRMKGCVVTQPRSSSNTAHPHSPLLYRLCVTHPITLTAPICPSTVLLVTVFSLQVRHSLPDSSLFMIDV